ncbi:MAG TPA: sigma-70 family RNA polymerase sigma factor [Spirochaetota bacterium]|nr:sigma-70 family RNA polymerase sigma factor [Spirochaetota bacterium]
MSAMKQRPPQSAVMALISRAEIRGHITQGEIDRAIERKLLKSEDIDWFLEELGTRGIRVDELAPKEETVDESPEIVGRDDPLSLYLAQVGKIPLLTRQQEHVLFERIGMIQAELEKRPDDQDLVRRLGFARSIVIQGNLRLVISIAKRYQKLGLSLLDLVEEGNIGLIEAVNRFEPARNVRFSTYGTWWIRQAIIKGLTEKARIIRIPVHIITRIKEISTAASELTQELGREPTFAEISHRAGIGYSRLMDILHVTQEPGSLDVPVEHGNMLQLGDVVEDERADQPVERMLLEGLNRTVSRVLDVLEPREREVIVLRFGLDGRPARTLKRTGEILGITRERVRQIQQRALLRIRSCSIAPELRDFFVDGDGQ